ncbi:hypothetical protein DK842_00260 [Chromobacterium phragmitis]|uniref:DUF1963 domain-containing protein n=1 Tax=Chromobacterium phragmitis TaxID=2202141 RepID=A0A344UEX7_9NEIS|nr:hypothetical protein [Chromobacterium phragmitis]AXE28498.1 hypothetical protein DK842_00260 [Chromobacterium phragmitis]AXE33825.1 hypothetical protein DK843_05545 [Chromobacterium phragmitis]
MQENIKTARPYLRVFPEPEQVFADPVERHAKHLLPCVSVALSAVNPAWEGWIHMVLPVEPLDGYVGECSPDYHNEYLAPNWLAFRLTESGHYQLLGDFRFFMLENMADEEWIAARSRLKTHYALQHRAFRETRDIYRRTGVLHSALFCGEAEARDLAAETPVSILTQLGGGAPGGNWCDSEGVKVDESDPDAVVPIGPNGERFEFIASVTGYDFMASGTTTLLFYHPESRVALLTFDWT